MYDIFSEIKRYCHVGVLNTLVGTACILALSFYGVDPNISNITGYSVGLVCSYVLSKFYVFENKSTSAALPIAFLFAFFAAFGANLLTLNALLAYGFAQPVSQVISIVVYSVVMYVLQKFWVFKK